MTTNQPGALDEAFKSRIHYKIHFPLLNRQQTLEIWQINIHRLRRMEQDLRINTTREPMEIPDEEILQFAAEQFGGGGEHRRGSGRRRTGHWNGRQIRNAFQVARSLAYADADAEAEAERARVRMAGEDEGTVVVPAPRLQVKHFQVMDDITTSFDQYMLEVYSGMNDVDLARESELRADEFVFRGQRAATTHVEMQTQQVYASGEGHRGLAPAFDSGWRSPRAAPLRYQGSRGQGSWVSGPSLGIPRGGNMGMGGERRSPSPMRGPGLFEGEASENGPLPGPMQMASQLLSPSSHRLSVDGGGARPISPGTSPIQARHVGRGSGDYSHMMGAMERNDDVECGQGYGDCKNEYGKRERAEPREMY